MNRGKGIERTKWFQEARFGMFIHWGLYSILGRGEWVMYWEQIPREEHALLAKKFNPGKFDINKWVSLAKEAGMKYIVLTTRHHDGFCLFDSKVSEFTAVNTAAKRDFVAAYVKACRRANLNRMVRRLQPNILINDRSGLSEDVVTPEQNIVASERKLRRLPRKAPDNYDTVIVLKMGGLT